jgi:hypothetical protein
VSLLLSDKESIIFGHLLDSKVFDLILEYDHGKIQAAIYQASIP